MVESTGALGIKVINAGASAAFKANARTFALDDEVPGYGVSSRQIVLALQQAVWARMSARRARLVARLRRQA